MLDGHFVRCRADNRTGGFSPDLSSERGRADGWGTNEGQRVFLRVDLFLRWTAPEATSVARQVLVVVEEVERMRVYPVGQEVTVQIELMHAPLAPRGANVHRFPRAPQLRTEPVSAVPRGGQNVRSEVVSILVQTPASMEYPEAQAAVVHFPATQVTELSKAPTVEQTFPTDPLHLVSHAQKRTRVTHQFCVSVAVLRQ